MDTGSVNPDFGVLDTPSAQPEATSAAPAGTDGAIPAAATEAKPNGEAKEAAVAPETSSGLEAYLALADQGIRPEIAIESVKALNLIGEYYRSKPELLLAEFEKSDPVAYRKFLDKAADEALAKYESEFPDLNANKAADDGAKGTPSSSVESPRISSLEREVKALREDRQREQETALANQRWNQATNDLNKLVDATSDQLKLNEDQKERLRLQAERDILTDPVALKRIAEGVRVDIPKKVSRVTQALSASIKERVEKEKVKREKVQATAKPTIVEGPQMTGPIQQGERVNPMMDWDTETMAFANDLKRAQASNS